MTVQLTPKFGDNYRIGDFGFTSTKGSFISGGITFCTADERMGSVYPAVSHVLFISGENECMEALPEGVVKSDLKKYFENKKVRFYVRRPRGLTDQIGLELKQIAENIVSQKLRYGFGLIGANALSKGPVDKLLNTLTFGWWSRTLFKVFDGKRSMICSEFAASVLQAHPEYSEIGCLRLPAREITPNRLMQDDGIFKPWKERIPEEDSHQIAADTSHFS